MDIVSILAKSFWTIFTLLVRKVYVYVEIKYDDSDIKHSLVITNRSNSQVKIIKLVAKQDTIGTKNGGINLSQSPMFKDKILEPNQKIVFAIDKKSLGDLKKTKTFQVYYKTRLFNKDFNYIQKSNLHSYVPYDHRISLYSALTQK